MNALRLIPMNEDDTDADDSDRESSMGRQRFCGVLFAVSRPRRYIFPPRTRFDRNLHMDMPASVEQMSELDMGSAEQIPHLAAPARRYRPEQEPKNLFDRIEAFVSRLSVRDNF